MRAFITHTTENYENITINLIKSIKKYSKYDIIVYTIDYDGSEKLQSEVKCVRLNLNLPLLDDNGFIIGSNGNHYVNRANVRSYFSLGAKIDSMIDASSFLDEWVYIDADSIVNKNVDDLFEYCDKITEFPLATLGPYEYVMTVNSDGSLNGNPFWKNDGSIDYENTSEWSLMKFMGLKANQRGEYRTTNILVGNNKVNDFLNLWKDVKNIIPRISNIFEITPFQEETIYNVLTWRINTGHEGLPLSYINVDGSSTLSHFFRTKVNNDTIIKEFYKLPKDKNKIKVFHGEKRQSEIDKMFDIIDEINLNKTKILFLTPHLSTGGMPSFLLKRIESLLEYYKDDVELFVVEFSNHSDHYVVQKNRIKELIPQYNFWTLYEDKNELIKIIEENQFDIIHLDEMVESFDAYNPLTPELMNFLYKNDRTWRIVETCHNITFKPNIEKHFHPEAYAYCSPWHKENTFKNMPSYGEVIEFPIEDKIPSSTEKLESKLKLGLDLNKKHILNVGLWTPGKNQKEGVELARLIVKNNPEYHFHFVGNQAPNFEEYWGPVMKDLPSNVTVWGERSDVDIFLTAADIFMFNSTWECNPLVLREAISYGLPTLSRNLPQYMDMFTKYIYPISDDLNKTKETLLSINDQVPTKYRPSTDQVKLFAEQHMNLYNKVMTEELNEQKMMNTEINIFQHFVGQPFLEIKGNSDKKYKVEFFDNYGFNQYTNEIGVNNWIKLNRRYYTKWRTKVSHNNETIYDEVLNLENERVYIAIDSKSLGDSIAWIPYALEFKNKHNCTVIVSTFWNNLFEKSYPELEFVKPGIPVHNLKSMYTVGWYYDADKEPEMPNTIPLQKTATNILGLEFKEIQPRISCNVGQSPYKEKYITIATNSTSGCKFWTREYWQQLINHLHSLGYQIINVSKEDNPFDNVSKIKDTSIENTMRVIYHSEFFIGLSSGLSWLAWGLGKQVVMISNFTEPDHEFTSNCIRIINKSVCNGCWNNPNFVFDKGDWNWCPEHKGTKRQFECHKSITPKMVIDQIHHLIK